MKQIPNTRRDSNLECITDETDEYVLLSRSVAVHARYLDYRYTISYRFTRTNTVSSLNTSRRAPCLVGRNLTSAGFEPRISDLNVCELLSLPISVLVYDSGMYAHTTSNAAVIHVLFILRSFVVHKNDTCITGNPPSSAPPRRWFTCDISLGNDEDVGTHDTYMPGTYIRICMKKSWTPRTR